MLAPPTCSPHPRRLDRSLRWLRVRLEGTRPWLPPHPCIFESAAIRCWPTRCCCLVRPQLFLGLTGHSPSGPGAGSIITVPQALGVGTITLTCETVCGASVADPTGRTARVSSVTTLTSVTARMVHGKRSPMCPFPVPARSGRYTAPSCKAMLVSVSCPNQRRRASTLVAYAIFSRSGSPRKYIRAPAVRDRNKSDAFPPRSIVPGWHTPRIGSPTLRSRLFRRTFQA